MYGIASLGKLDTGCVMDAFGPGVQAVCSPKTQTP